MRSIISIAVTITLFACKREARHSYAIKDFRVELQPQLHRIVAEAIVQPYDSALHFMATDNELKRLSNSEHPILRACALKEMLERISFNYIDVLFNHLDDTATVVTDEGEFGVDYQAVSDYLLEGSRYKTQEEKNKVIDRVLTKHNYLRSAYTILTRIEPQEKYYTIIKKMAAGNRKFAYDPAKHLYDVTDCALYGLAKFRKKEDIPLIREALLKKPGWLSSLSFALMKEFPDSSYMQVYEAYYPNSYYKAINFREVDEAVDFIQSIASYKNERSAAILQAILDKKTINDYSTDSYIKERLLAEIAKYKGGYAKIEKQFAKQLHQYQEDKITLPLPAPVTIVGDTSERTIRWWQQ